MIGRLWCLYFEVRADNQMEFWNLLMKKKLLGKRFQEFLEYMVVEKKNVL